MNHHSWLKQEMGKELSSMNDKIFFSYERNGVAGGFAHFQRR